MSKTADQGSPASAAKVLFPRAHKVLPRHAFFATGVASANTRQLLGVLSKDGSEQTYTGRTLRQPPASTKWVIFFKVPDAGSKARDTLRLYQRDTSGSPLAEVQGIRFLREEAVVTSFPGDGEDCCADFFFAQGGLTPPDTSISATMKRRDSAAGTPSNQPIVEQGNWFADWPPLEGSDTYLYDLDVEGDGGGSDPRKDLHLHSRYC